jgi:DNA-binding FadR family transcriptional regulator
MAKKKIHLFEPFETVRSSEKVADAISRNIVNGKIRPGENLPPERSLAEQFRVTRNTVREALRSLEHSRLISVRQGSGITVQDYLTNAGLEFASVLLGSSVSHKPGMMRDIAEARSVIGRAMVHHAIDNMQENEIPVVSEAIGRFTAEAKKVPPDVRKLQELDFEVQNRLIHAGSNRAMILLHNSMRRIYYGVARLFRPMMENPEAVAGYYQRALDALGKGDREKAKQIFSAYFDMGRNALSRKKTK